MKDIIEIKDEKVNVEQIMERIRRRIEEKKAKGLFDEKDIRDIEEMELKLLPDSEEIVSFYESHLYKDVEKEVAEAMLNSPNPIKRFIAKRAGSKLFGPIYRFLYRSYLVEEQMKRTVHYVRLLHNLSHNLVAELSKLRVRHDYIEMKLKTLEEKLSLLENRFRTYEKSK